MHGVNNLLIEVISTITHMQKKDTISGSFLRIFSILSLNDVNALNSFMVSLGATTIFLSFTTLMLALNCQNKCRHWIKFSLDYFIYRTVVVFRYAIIDSVSSTIIA
jgi:hypothetical protein